MSSSSAVLEQAPNTVRVQAEDAEKRQDVVGSAAPAAGTRGENLPKRFLKGVAISVWQNSGGENSNWGRFCESTGKCCGLIPNIMDRSSPNDGGCGFWERYEHDIELAKKLGTTAFRLSLEWHRIEPSPGVIDQDAVKRYHQILNALEAANMDPSATLHHFVHPDWFEARGAFEKEENIQAFVDFSVFCAREFGHRIQKWCTFNEPTCFLVCGYLVGVHPPGKINNLVLMGTVLHNMLKAHALVYKAIKAVPQGANSAIGLVHHHVEFMPLKASYWWAKPVTWWGTFWWGRDTVLEFLQTGKFEWHVPLWGKTISSQAREKPGLDWWGINYYTRGVVGAFVTPIKVPGEHMTDMGYQLYPQGLYENIARGAALGVPMYISEIGAADRSESDYIRKAHIESFMNQIFRAIRDGFDVRGVFYWTLMDNFEWNTGYTMKFGLYNWDKGKPEQQRTLKEGGRLLARIFQSMPDDMAELAEYCRANKQVSEYERELELSYAKHKILPVIWNHGKLVSVEPLSPLHLRIGLADMDPEVTQETRAHAAADPAFAAA